MKIKYLGHAAFLITTGSGIRIITDPYQRSPTLTYGEITEPADVVTVSHGHRDHYYAAGIKGNPVIVSAAGGSSVKGIEFRGIPSFHDGAAGSLRGNNVIFCFEADTIKLCHLGDLGHLLDSRQIDKAGVVDVLLIPVGGYYTIDAAAATLVSEQLRPRVIIPMHYRTEGGTPNISGVEAFLRGKANVTRLQASEIAFKREGLPTTAQVIVLKPALLPNQA